jgi:hypothetical protein
MRFRTIAEAAQTVMERTTPIIIDTPDGRRSCIALTVPKIVFMHGSAITNINAMMSIVQTQGVVRRDPIWSMLKVGSCGVVSCVRRQERKTAGAIYICSCPCVGHRLCEARVKHTWLKLRSEEYTT